MNSRAAGSVNAPAEEEAPAAAVVPRRKPVGPRRAVPHRDDAAGVGVLPVDYQALMAAALEQVTRSRTPFAPDRAHDRTGNGRSDGG
ncbi:hypothetical protein SUDANB58_01208 [Streptomyces sp. enrichment culture]